MTIIIHDRAALDRVLNDPRTTILLVAGANGSTAGEVHTVAGEGIGEEWRHTVWVQSLHLLKPEETAWLGGNLRFATVCGAPKKLHASGAIADLLLPDNTADIIAITKLFAAADGGVQPPPPPPPPPL